MMKLKLKKDQLIDMISRHLKGEAILDDLNKFSWELINYFSTQDIPLVIQNLDFGFEKTLQLNDRNNIKKLAIAQSREISLCQKPNFEIVGGIEFLLINFAKQNLLKITNFRNFEQALRSTV